MTSYSYDALMLHELLYSKLLYYLHNFNFCYKYMYNLSWCIISSKLVDLLDYSFFLLDTLAMLVLSHYS